MEAPAQRDKERKFAADDVDGGGIVRMRRIIFKISTRSFLLLVWRKF